MFAALVDYTFLTFMCALYDYNSFSLIEFFLEILKQLIDNWTLYIGIQADNSDQFICSFIYSAINSFELSCNNFN